MKFAVIKNNIVTNVILADSVEIAELVTGAICIRSDVATIGAAYDQESNSFIVLELVVIEPVVEDPS